MKKIIYIILPLLLMGCEDFLDTESLVKKNTSNFPQTVEDASQALVGIYATLPFGFGGPTAENPLLVSEILSDDRLGGGGDGDRKFQAYNVLMKTDENMLSTFWSQRYQGIFRANTLLSIVDNIKKWDSESQKNQLLGETLYLRAYSYFELCRMFGTVPLIITPDPVNNPRATPEELYARIASDLKEAIRIMSPATFGTSGAPELGHATKWAAEALMARVFLFYTGYYNKTEIPLTDGSTVKKQDVIAWLEDCINNSGHGLIDDFRNLWPYSNEYTSPDYEYANSNNLKWAGESGGNKETIFALKFSIRGNWTNIAHANAVICYFSLRSQPDYTVVFPFGQGYGAATVSPVMFEEWQTKEPGDLRRDGSILDVDNPVEKIEYTWGQGRQIEETGYWQKKYTAINHKKEDASIENFSVPMYGCTPNFQFDNTQDIIIIRFADILLMMAELKEDAAYINQIRKRAGLNDLPAYSLEKLQDERRWELAFEGHRYYDLLRWNIAGKALEKQHGAKIKNRGVDGTMDMKNIAQRIKDTGGFMPVPQSQIDLSNGVLEQTPGWSDGNLLFAGY